MLFIERNIEKINFWFKGFVIVFIIGFLVLFRYIMPFGYHVQAIEGNKIYQYQTLSKDDVRVLEISLRAPWDNGFDEVDDYDIVYDDYKGLNLVDYIHQHPVLNINDIGEQIILSNPDGKFVILINGRPLTVDIDIVKATKAELGYSGETKVGDVLDLEQIYLDVEYENGEIMNYSIDQFSITDTEDLVLKRGYNNFTVQYAGETFLLSVLCEE